jgi:hypothetical protein
MEKLNEDTLSVVVAYLPNRVIKKLSRSSSFLHNTLSKINNNFLFWKERTELLLEKYITNDNSINWKEVYKILLRYIGEKQPYQILPIFAKKNCLDAQKIIKKYGHNREDTYDNLMKAIKNEKFEDFNNILENDTEPKIYNNSVFLDACKLLTMENDYETEHDYVDGIRAAIIALIKHNRIDILTINQKLMFDVISDVSDNYDSDFVAKIFNTIIKKLDTNYKFNNSVFFWSVKNYQNDTFDYLLNYNKIDIFTVDQDHLFDIIEELDYSEGVVNVLLKIFNKFGTDINFNNSVFIWSLYTEKYDLTNYLLNYNKINLSILDIEKVTSEISMVRSKDLEILIKILKIYILDPRVNIAIKEHIKDSLSGLLAMHYLYSDVKTKNIGNILSFNETYITEKEFCRKLLVHLLTKKLLMIDVVKWLEDNVDFGFSGRTKKIIHQSVISVLYDIKYINDKECYNGLRGLLLLSFRPRYTYKQILDKLKSEGVSQTNISFSAKIIGAKLGLKQLINDGLILTDNLNKFINNELK